MRDSIGGARHHGPHFSAIGVSAIGVFAIGGLLALLGAPAAAQEDALVQRGIPAEATAENAVVARERAIANAQRIAYGRMAAAAGISGSASAAQIESAVSSLIVESERTTLNGYQGRFTVRFNAARVASLGGRVASSAAAADPNAPPRPPAAPEAGNAAFVPPPGYVPGTPSPGGGPAAAYLDAATTFRSLNEWVALRRPLLSQPSVSSVDIVAISTDGARLRLGLRSAPATAAGELASGGIVLAPTAPAGSPRGAMQPGWRVGLAGGA